MGSTFCKSAQDKGFRRTILEYIKRFDFFKSFSFTGAIPSPEFVNSLQLINKFCPQHKAYRTTRFAELSGSLCITEVEGNKRLSGNKARYKYNRTCHPELGCLLLPKTCFRAKWLPVTGSHNKEILNSHYSCEPQRFSFQNDISKDELFNHSTFHPFNLKGGGTVVPESLPSSEFVNSLPLINKFCPTTKREGLVEPFTPSTLQLFNHSPVQHYHSLHPSPFTLHPPKSRFHPRRSPHNPRDYRRGGGDDHARQYRD